MCMTSNLSTVCKYVCMPISVDIYSWLNILTEVSVQILSTKRKQSVLSLEKQHTILSCMEKGCQLSLIVWNQQTASFQHSKERRKHGALIAHSFQTSNGGQRKSLKLAKNKELDRSVQAWFIQELSKGMPVWGELMLFTRNEMFWSKTTLMISKYMHWTTNRNALDWRFFSISCFCTCILRQWKVWPYARLWAALLLFIIIFCYPDFCLSTHKSW